MILCVAGCYYDYLTGFVWHNPRCFLYRYTPVDAVNPFALSEEALLYV